MRDRITQLAYWVDQLAAAGLDPEETRVWLAMRRPFMVGANALSALTEDGDDGEQRRQALNVLVTFMGSGTSIGAADPAMTDAALQSAAHT